MRQNVLLLLNGIWDLGVAKNDRQWARRSIPYVRHYRHVLKNSIIDGLNTDQLAELINCIKRFDPRVCSVPDLVSHVRKQNFSWLQTAESYESILRVLDTAMQLLLFTKTELRTCSGTLKDVVEHSTVANIGLHKMNGTLEKLSTDFCLKNLERRGGFTIHWTSEIAEHLECVNEKVIKVFRHQSALQNYLECDGWESLLSEIDKTFYLLFPYQGIKADKIALKESNRRRVDLVEAGWMDDSISEYDRLQLATYPIFASRLAEIQCRYDAARPSNLKQWWYDRRQRMEWAALLIAVLVFILTLITLATSILQVYAAFRNK